MELDSLEMHILRKLYRHTYIGRRHMAIEDLVQGLPDDCRDMRTIAKAVKRLFNNGYVLLHKRGFRISLNPRVLGEVRNLV